MCLSKKKQQQPLQAKSTPPPTPFHQLPTHPRSPPPWLNPAQRYEQLVLPDEQVLACWPGPKPYKQTRAYTTNTRVIQRKPLGSIKDRRGNDNLAQRRNQFVDGDCVCNIHD